MDQRNVTFNASGLPRFSIGGWVKIQVSWCNFDVLTLSQDGPNVILVDSRRLPNGIVLGARLVNHSYMALSLNLHETTSLVPLGCNISTGDWTYLGVTVDGVTGRATFLINTTATSLTFNSTAHNNFSVFPIRVGGAQGKSSLHNLTALVRSFAVLPTALSTGDHAYLANLFASQLGIKPFPGATQFMLNTSLWLDASNSTDVRSKFKFPTDPGLA